MTSKITPLGSLVTVTLEVKPTYNYAVSAFAAVATPTDVVVITGSATKRIAVKRITIIGAATGAGQMPVLIIRRSTAGTLGSAVLTAIPAAKHDSSQAAATAAVSTVGTANYTTVGTTAGTIAAGRVQMMVLGTSTPAVPFDLSFGDLFNKPIYLRGVAELCCINFNGAAIPSGGVLDITIEIEEDDGI